MGGQKRQRDDSHEIASTDHPSFKKRREHTDSDAKLAKIYNDLADEIEDVRLTAAAALIKHITADEAARESTIDAAITRLIKGVNSGRKAARLGFSVALPEVIRIASQTGALSLLQLINKVEKLTKMDKNATAQEKRDALLGKQFALQALLQAAPSIKADAGLWRLPFEHICDLSKQRPWLRRQCGMSLHQYILNKPPAQQLQALTDAWSNQALWRTPEGVALWLVLAENDEVKLPKHIWTHQSPLSSKERLILAKVMQEIPVDDDDTQAKSGTRQITPSFAWTVVLQALSQHEKEKNFVEFWDTAMSNGLLGTSASDERKAFGIQVLLLAIKKLDAKSLDHILTKQILQLIVNQRSNNDRNLFEAAHKPLKAIVSRAQAEPATAAIFLKQLLKFGVTNFDRATKTKTVETLLGEASLDTLEKIVDDLHDLMLMPGTTDEKTTDNQRRVLADMLLNTLRSHREPLQLFSEDDVAPWVSSICRTLIDAAYEHETTAEIAEPALSAATRSVCRARLMSCIGHLLSFPLERAMLLPVAIVSELQASQVAKYAKMKDAEVEALHTAEKLLKKLGKKAKKLLGDNVANADALKLLLSMSMLQVHNQEPDSNAALDDLIMSIQTWVDGSDESRTIITEIIISFISKQSAAYRKLAEQVFSALAASMTSDSLQSFIDILQQKESTAGQAQLFGDGEDVADGADEDDEDDEDAYVNVEDDSDVEIVNGVVAGDGEDSSSDDDSDESMDDVADDEGAEFDRKLKLALGSAALDSDDDGSDLDDDQMLALEPHLEAVFKERKKETSTKKDSKDARDNIINFKNRILDLLNIYVKTQHSSPCAIELIHPLVELIRTTTNRPTGEKAFAVLKTYVESYTKDKSSTVEVEDDVLFALLGVLHAEAGEDGSKMHTSACGRACTFVAKLLIASDVQNYKQVSKMYSELQSTWYLDPKSKIQSSLFNEWNSWSISTKPGSKH